MKLPSLTEVLILALLALVAFWPAGGVVSGPLTLIIASEHQNQPTDLASLQVQLRDGQAAKTLADRGHTLLMLDNEDASISAYKPFDDSKPELLKIGKGAKLLSRGPVPMTVADFLKAAGD